MTAEIAILNKHGVALAADSAVTITNGNASKTYNAANKLFSFGSAHDIGFMIYGDADYMGIPWEIIFKEYRRVNKQTVFKTIEDCANQFIDFVKQPKFNNPEIAKEQIQAMMYRALVTLTEYAGEDINAIQAQSDNHEIDDGQIVDIIKEKIESMRRECIDRRFFKCDIEPETFLGDFQGFCIDILTKHFKLPFEEFLNDFLTFMYELVIYRNMFESISGIVICGYGEDELFPSLVSYELSFSYNERLKLIKKEEVEISSVGCTASIIPFAQSDMILTILKGMDPAMELAVSDKIRESSLTSEEKDSIINSIADTQKENFIDPILNIVGMLSIDELANMAATLVNLTSFKRHYTDSLETVGGPVDVLVVTRGDGPIWINRKEYFDINKNIDYQLRKKRCRL
ncbi:hypothetical protein BVE84_05435 [Streptococcus azizii]|uniref:Uncharacterized protein n=1 Tax=Streptococcus azizii TaxID=1579424 RepID=A0AB36JN65_9STRE|nr:MULTISPECIES: hypothetical protein [Streptococcus]QBX22555.1 hypothetical protein Javan85_0058 [Streptococcus phage Javan85]QBX31878.1 hypothetical protein Javan84_0001 [Streptococcus phage Javan84]MBF0775949.1 hypothetical protein [Streptococcus sp. 19428wD3_AN2]MBF0787571.1 hypothetical protein [Streptococcus sp. 19428wC2_LYSM12]ONK25608.1 hypothetical protein BVE86_09840 [Streptococcus azizii]